MGIVVGIGGSVVGIVVGIEGIVVVGKEGIVVVIAGIGVSDVVGMVGIGGNAVGMAVGITGIELGTVGFGAVDAASGAGVASKRWRAAILPSMVTTARRNASINLL